MASEDLKNRTNKNLANIVGSIGPAQNQFGGLSQDELLEIVMSITPIGRVGAGKGAISFLKNLFGKAKSKYKFPHSSSFPTEPPHSAIDNLIAKDEILKLVKSVKKQPISSYIPDNLPKTALPPNPNLTKIITRNDPGMARMREALSKLKK